VTAHSHRHTSVPETPERLDSCLLFPSGRIYSILVFATGKRKRAEAGETGAGGGVPKRKPGRFSAAKAVKANARDRVGQPKPARVVEDAPRTGRQAKHKPKMDDLIQQGE
jgi:hypothetical protein